MLNACIGASSAPFYDKWTSCSKYELTEQCTKIERLSSAIYAFEVIGSILLVFHGLLGMVLLEYIKNLKLIKIMRCYTQVAFVLYACDALIRIFIYIKILNLLAPVETEGNE